jgi:hypothetical protein
MATVMLEFGIKEEFPAGAVLGAPTLPDHSYQSDILPRLQARRPPARPALEPMQASCVELVVPSADGLAFHDDLALYLRLRHVTYSSRPARMRCRYSVQELDKLRPQQV